MNDTPADTPTRFDAFPKKTTREWPAVGAGWTSVLSVSLALFPHTSELYAWPVSVLTLAAGVSALILRRQGRAKAMWPAIIAVVLSVAAVGCCVFWSLSLRQVHIRYELRGDAPYVMLTYTEAYNHEGSATRLMLDAEETFPWNYDLGSARRRDPGELVATIPSGTPTNKTISCAVYVDAVRVKYEQATGPMAVADCSGF